MTSIPREICRADLCLLSFFAEKGKFARLKQSLQNPFAFESRDLFNSSQQEFSEQTTALQNRLPEASGLMQLYELHLITHCLLFGDTLPGWVFDWVEKHIDIRRFFHGFTFDQLRAGRWAAVPVFLVMGEACVRYFIAGALSDGGSSDLWPDWGAALLDDRARSGVRDAARLSGQLSSIGRSRRFYCYPLAVANRTVQFEGLSMGLPLAMGFAAAAAGQSLPRALGSSGALAAEGGVIEVEHLDQKAECAARNGYSVFLYPSLNTKPALSLDCELLPVADISEAAMFASLYAPGKGKDLLIFTGMLKDPRAFVNNLDGIDPKWIRWAAGEGKWQHVTGRMARSAELFSGYVEKLGRMHKDWRLEAAGAVSELVSPAVLERAAQVSPLSAFRYCTQRLALANHRGDAEAARKWAKSGDDLFGRAIRASIDACADYLNNRFITLHNRFDFKAEFPKNLREILACLEARYGAQCEGGCTTDRTLAGLYGSIAQNYGFCGPEYLAQCHTYVERAVAAFGGGEVPELKNDLLRQFSYLVYASLDEKRFGAAREALLRYLEVEDWSDLWSKIEKGELSRWHHAALARFFADVAPLDETRSYFDWAIRNAGETVDRDHPLQLWLHNLGRIACNLMEPAEAGNLFSKSLELCLSHEIGPTVRVMALLPLSGLWKLDAVEEILFDKAWSAARSAAEELNPKYFRLFFEMKPEMALESLWHRPSCLFPFSYR